MAANEVNMNEWRRTYVATMSNAKLRKFARMMAISIFEARGLLEAFWDWAHTNAQDGILTGFDLSDVLYAIRWDGDPNEFKRCMLECGQGGFGFLEEQKGQLLIHDWTYNIGDKFGRRDREAHRKQRNRKRLHEQDLSECPPDNPQMSRGRPADVPREMRGDEMRGVQEEMSGVEMSGGSPSVRDAHSAPTPELTLSPAPATLPPAAVAPRPAAAVRVFLSKKERKLQRKLARQAKRAVPNSSSVFTTDPTFGPVPGIDFDGTAYFMLTQMYPLVPEYEADPLPEQRLVQDLGRERPDVNLRHEFSKAESWLRDNPGRVTKNLRQFLRNWIRRSDSDPDRLFVPAPPEPICIAH